MGPLSNRAALFYGLNRRRTEVRFDAGLRRRTEDLAARMHALYSAKVTPSAAYAKKCDRCSLYNRCLPRMASKRAGVARYMAGALQDEGMA